jgi:hypothetical protein
MRADVGFTDNVTGSSKAIARAGPIPGKTPTRVPKNVPSNPYMRFCADRALEKPSSKRLRLSIT